ncbi:MAG TPA: tetratricopeptide repeat protein [Xanthobacteraceae bacterium]|nr:tetratricopeptide repeat protein [Xanthobacteraceae bacterium]
MTRPTTVVLLLAGMALLDSSAGALAQAKPDDARTCALESGAAALDGCTRAIASRRFGRSELALLHYRRGVLRRAASDLDGAIADFTAAIHLNGDVIPTSADAFDLLISQRNAYRQRGQTFVDKSDYERALADVDALLKADAKDIHALALRAGILVKQGACARAIADFDAVVAIDAKAWDGYLGRAQCYVKLGERDRAVADYRTALAGGVPDAVKSQILEELQKLGAAP